MIRTPLRSNHWSLAVLAMLSLFAAACSVTPSPDLDELAGIDRSVDEAASVIDNASAATAEDAPAELAFVDNASSSPEFCDATANIWVHSSALNMIGFAGNAEMNQIALANVAEWLERSTLFDNSAIPSRVAMFEAFTELQETVTTDFGSDWQIFQESDTYADASAAAVYETERTALISFISRGCDDVNIVSLQTDAEARAEELKAEFASAPSSVAESESLPGHAIFSHSSGRLISSFPTAWDYEERTGDAIVDFIASPDIEQFLDGQAIDGVRLQLVDAAALEDFRKLIDETMTGTSCLRTNDLTDDSAARLHITQTFACSDHGASVIGQYDAIAGVGLIVEASFDRVDASRADLMRLVSISNSALWH